ncbi:MAG: M16 family metallopeptidase [Candidatus Saccharimonadales bacterium]
MKHKVYELVLPNGARGLAIHVPDSSVMTFDINFRAGDCYTQPKKWETAHIMEHLMFGANKQIPKARAFQAEFEKNGAYSNASTSSYDIIYEAECADFEWNRVLDLMMKAITEPLFLEEEFKAEFGNVREELMARGNNHFRHLSLALRNAYGFLVLTDQTRFKLMENVELKDIKDHYKKTHTTSNLRFVIAGNLPPERRKQIKSLFSNMNLPAGEGRIELPDEKPVKLAEPLYIANPTIDNLYFYMDTFMDRRLRDPETDALGLVNTMLTETLYSRMFGTARERGLVYGMSSGFGYSKSSSGWWVGAQVMPKNAPALVDIIVKELQGVFKNKLKDQDIAAAKQYSLGRYQRSGQTVGGTANGYSYRYFFDDVIDDYYKVPERIKAVSRNRIVDVMQAVFAEDIWGLGVLGNVGPEFAQKMADQLKTLW